MKRPQISLIVILFFILTSFGGTKTFKKTAWIPAGFDCRNNILLVEKAALPVPAKKNEKIQSDMLEIMQQEYPYKYEFASSREIIEGSTFADKDKYRWALLTTPVTITSGTMLVNAIDFYIYDRKMNIKYKATGYYDSFLQHVMKPTVATIVKYLQELKEPKAPPQPSH